MEYSMIRVFILDDEEDFCNFFKRTLEEKYYFVVDAETDGNIALEKIRSGSGMYDVAIIDEILADGLNGIEVIRKIRSEFPEIECILFTGAGRESRHEALQAGVYRHMNKSFNPEELVREIRNAAQQVRFNMISRQILTATTLQEVLPNIIAAARSLAFADEASIVLYKSETNQTENLSGIFSNTNICSNLFINHSLTHEIIHKGKPYYNPDICGDGDFNQMLKRSGFCSFIGLPIPGETGHLGVLYTFSKKAHNFDGSTIATLRSVAGQAGTAIANINAIMNTRDHLTYMNALVKTSENLAKAASQEEMLNLVWNYVSSQFKISMFYIALLNESTSEIRFPIFIEKGVDISKNIPRIPLESMPGLPGITQFILKTGEELDANTMEELVYICDSKQIKSKLVGEPSQSSLYLPLKIGERLLGVISIQSETRCAFSKGIKESFRALASHLVVSLEKFRYQEERLRRLEGLLNLSLSVNSTSDVQKIFEDTCREVCKIFAGEGIEHCGLMVYTPGNTHGVVMADCPQLITRPEENRKRRNNMIIPVEGDRIEEKYIREKLPKIINNVVTDLNPGLVKQNLLDHKILSTMWVPVLGKDQEMMLASFSLDAVNHLRTFDNNDVRLARIIANHIGVAIENARMNGRLDFLLTANEGLSDSSKRNTGHVGDILDIGLNNEALRLVNQLRPEGATFCIILLIDKEKHYLILHAAQPIERGQKLQLPPCVITKRINLRIAGTTYLKELMDSGEPTILHSTNRTDNKHLDHIAEKLELRQLSKSGELSIVKIATLLSIPLQTPEKHLGILMLGETRGGPEAAFGKQTIQLVKAYARQLSLFIDRSQEQMELDKRLQDMEGLRILGEVLLLHVSDFKLTLQQITKIARKVLHADLAVIYPLLPRTTKTDVSNIAHDGLKKDRNFKDSDKDRQEGSMLWQIITKGEVVVENVASGMDRTRQLRIWKDPGKLMYDEEVEAFLGLRLRANGEDQGVLYIDFRTIHEFDSYEIEISRILANLAAAAIQKARLFERLNEESINLREKLLESVSSISQLGGINKTLKIIADGLRKVLGCNLVTAYWYTYERQEFLLPAIHSGTLKNKAKMNGRTNLPNNNIFQFLLHTKMPHYSEDVCKDSIMSSGNFALREKIKSSAGISLWAGKHPNGLLFANYRSPHQFTVEERKAFEIFARIAAVAINNAITFKMVRDKESILNTVHEAGLIVTSYNSLEKTLELITEQAYKLMKNIGKPFIRFSQIALVEKDENGQRWLRFKIRWQDNGVIKNDVACRDVNLDKINNLIGIAGKAVNENRIILVKDIMIDSLRDEYISLDPNTRSELAVPIVYNDEVIGVINVEDSNPDGFDRSDKEALVLLSTQAAVAINNARTIKLLEKTKNRELSSTMLAWMGMENSTWIHEINRYAATIDGEVNLLRMKLEHHMETDIEKSLNMIQKKVIDIHGEFVAPSLGEEIDIFDLNDVIGTYVNNPETKEIYRKNDINLLIEIKSSEKMVVQANRFWLVKALDHLLENSMDALKDSKEKQIRVGTRLRGKNAEFYVADTGPGFSIEDLKTIETGGQKSKKGMGKALQLTRLIIEAYGGEMIIDVSVQKGAIVVLRLPIHYHK